MMAIPAGVRVRIALLLPILTMTVGLGCRRPHVEGTVAVDTILRAWTDQGFDSKTVENVDPEGWDAGACARGSVSGMDVLLCEFANDNALNSGEQKIMRDWQDESVATGVAARTSRTLMAITDRDSVDPDGRTITRLVQIFRAQH
jgi:hypothetical protein